MVLIVVRNTFGLAQLGFIAKKLYRKAIGEEVNRLLEANFIREIKQATWVANPVLVPKKNTKV